MAFIVLSMCASLMQTMFIIGYKIEFNCLALQGFGVDVLSLFSVKWCLFQVFFDWHIFPVSRGFTLNLLSSFLVTLFHLFDLLFQFVLLVTLI